MTSIISLSDYLRTVLPDAVLISVFRPLANRNNMNRALYGFVFRKATNTDHYVVEVAVKYSALSHKWRAKKERKIDNITVSLAVLGVWDRKEKRFSEAPALTSKFTIDPDNVAVVSFMDSVREMYFDFRDATQTARASYE